MNIAKKTLFVAALVAGFGVAQAQDRVYVTDTRDVVTTSGYNLCWRTGFWTPAAAASDPAGCQCDRDLLPREACEAAAPATPVARPTADKISIAADALFDFNSATLRPEGVAKLNDLAAQTQAINLEVILAVGHTDRLGKEAYNQRLSERRAAAVRNHLISQGVPGDRIYTEGKGSTQSVTGTTCNQKSRKALIECLQPDRRVDIELIGTR